MRLVSLAYSQFQKTDKEWNLELLTLNKVNLIVGKNATGKSKTLALISNIAKLFRRELSQIFVSGSHTLTFDDDGKSFKYSVEFNSLKVVSEYIEFDGEVLLNRTAGGSGTIYYEKDQSNKPFQSPDTELAAVVRRDSLQHSFLEKLYNWACSVYFYEFGSPMGKNILHSGAITIDRAENLARDANRLVEVFSHGEAKLGDEYLNAIKDDLSKVGYNIERLQVTSMQNIPFPAPLHGMAVKESDLTANTEQPEMSQGMFRVVSIIVLINYLSRIDPDGCILIDDIGEGIDFERSCNLIEVLMNKAKENNFQIIMTSNDRFVMNTVPLEFWTVLTRNGQTTRVCNIKNSPNIFEEFQFTGLNNFDFFSSNYAVSSDGDE